MLVTVTTAPRRTHFMYCIQPSPVAGSTRWQRRSLPMIAAYTLVLQLGVSGPANRQRASPEVALNESVAKRVQATYRGRMAAPPEAVARTIEKAASARHPRTRCVVTAGARMLLLTRRLLPDRAFDAVLRTQFPVSKPKK